MQMYAFRQVPLAELWDGFNPRGVKNGYFVTFKGYMDESFDNSQKLFCLSCLTARGSRWSEFERAWKKHLAAANRKLKKQGRPLISRYHASDCSGRRNDFKGWEYEERDNFVRGLFGIFKRIAVHAVAYDVDLDDLCDVFPEWADDRLKTAYHVLTRFVIYTLGEDFDRQTGGKARGRAKFTLFHDRTADGRYDPVILEAFNTQVHSGGFDYADYFTTIAPLDWRDCIALQPADLVAFEMFKEAQAIRVDRDSRKSFEALMNMKAFGIHHRSFRKPEIVKFRKHIEAVKAQVASSSPA